MITLIEDPAASTSHRRRCALRECVLTVGDSFTPYYEVSSAGEPPALFCVECGDWLRDAMRLEVTTP